ncbi:MAG TPA: FAD-dependent thymidylate synthase [candidate division Zixibacteria bacterium]|nr:FAD-dependent thymidylate synthase [candidate division Zixibacteria bacterium]
MAHNHNSDGDAILDREFPVLDKGFVRLVDYLGSDERIVQSARVSYGEGTTSFRRDRQLIRYLYENEHTSPFEQVVFTFHIKLPIFVARQWIRHRTARLNEVSGRYSVLPDEFYIPVKSRIRAQDNVNRQGSAEELPPEAQETAIADIERACNSAFEAYHKLLDHGVAREVARIVLPLNTYTEWYWQMDLRNLFHFLKLRLDEHAQWEIRQYAEVIAQIVEKIVPISFEAFRDYTLSKRP